MKQQTAVGWLQIQLKNGVDFNPLDPLSYPKAVDNLFEKAKQMEKEQIVDACNANLKGLLTSGKDYYNQTYKNK